MSEGVPGEDWAAVAQVISDRVRELGWRQRELAERSRVSAAVVREIQLHTVERRRSPRTLESLSVALGWEPSRLDSVLRGNARHDGAGRPGDSRCGCACGRGWMRSTAGLTKSPSLFPALKPRSPR